MNKRTKSKKQVKKRAARKVKRERWCPSWPNCACILRGKVSDCQ